ncbi:GNAT family N-acetyltransferase [Allokutzneria oryzae]|uniref:GNAT family N-acetyltransferase n=1 Tax=Allokutzneria oryzae TaxID=1378989 RepID=A0ABV6A1V2_9PSEU
MTVDSRWWEQPVLIGRHVRLEPLTLEHAEGLHAAGEDPEIWRWLSWRQPADLAGTRKIIESGVADRERGVRLPWAQIDQRTGEVAGTTSFYEIVPAHGGIAIGYTWIGAPWQRTALNTEAKLLLLGRAFETLGAHRVTWHTDINNHRSQQAITRLGALREGVHRHHRVRPDGSLRDTVTFSMIAEEWPGARARLSERLTR